LLFSHRGGRKGGNGDGSSSLEKGGGELGQEYHANLLRWEGRNPSRERLHADLHRKKRGDWTALPKGRGRNPDPNVVERKVKFFCVRATSLPLTKEERGRWKRKGGKGGAEHQLRGKEKICYGSLVPQPQHSEGERSTVKHDEGKEKKKKESAR